VPLDSLVLRTFDSSSPRERIPPPIELDVLSPPRMHNLSSVEGYDPLMLAKSSEDSWRTRIDQKVSAWIADTQWYSSISSITRHPEFASLVEMRTKAIRFALERLDAGEVRVHWFPLLKRASGEDPVPPEKRGIVPEMATEWLRWGRKRGYLRRR
jgi:hypothetical protein